MLGKHLLGIYEKAMPDDMSWDERLAVAAELGFDFVEMSVDETDERISRLDWSQEQIDELRELMSRHGVNIQSICLSAHRRFPFGSADAGIRSKAVEIMDKAVIFADRIGARVIQLAGYDVYYENSTSESKDFFVMGLRQACVTAEKYQVMLALEIMDTEFVNSIAKFEEYKSRLHSPWFTVYPDLGNMSAWGDDMKKELELGSSSIVAVHLKDTIAVKPGYPGKFKRVPFGRGCVDFKRCFRLLERQGYAGPYLIEMWNQPGTDSREEIAAVTEFIKDEYIGAFAAAEE